MNQQMSRESRKIVDELNRQAELSGVQGLVPVHHIYLCDCMIINYYTQPILNVIKSKMPIPSKREWKHFTPEYWSKIIPNMFMHNKSAQRDNNGVSHIYSDKIIDNFALITQSFMITDYSIGDAMAIHNIANYNDHNEIQSAINTSITYGARGSINYLNSVLNMAKAKSDIESKQIQALRDRIDKSSNILDKPVVQHSPVDIAVAQYSWKNKRDNAEIMRRLEEIENKGD